MLDVQDNPLPREPVAKRAVINQPAAFAAVLLVLTGLCAVWLTIRTQNQAGWVKHTLQVENQLDLVLSTMQNAETGQRGYLLTGNKVYLQPFHTAETAIKDRLDRAMTLTLDNPVEQHRLKTLRLLIADKFAELKQTITLQQAGNAETARAVVLTNRGHVIMQRIRAIISAMHATEDHLLTKREAKAAASEWLLLATVAAAVLLALAFAGAWIQSIARNDRQLRAANQEVLAVNSQLEILVAERTRRLDASEAEFRTLAQSMPSLMFVTDANGANTYTNAQFHDYAGLAGHQLLGNGWMQVIHPDDAAHTKTMWNKSVLSGDLFEIEYRFRRHDGVYHWFLGRSVPVRNEAGRISHWIGTCTDIDDQKRAEAMLANANVRLEARVAARARELDRIFKLSLDILTIVGFDKGFRSMSPAWERITGRPLEEALTRPVADFVHPDDREMTNAVHERLIRGEPAIGFENRYERADGSYCRLAWRAVSIVDEGLIYAVARDVTEERGRDEQLRQSQKMEVVGQLTGGIAHDFNNLLTIIIGSLELMQRDLMDGDAKLRRWADTATEGARRAAALTHRLLAFSRRQPLEPKPIEINRLVGGMSELLQRTLGEPVAIETVLAAGLWPALADANQLENTLLNLAVNARDAMPGGGRLTIETANVHLDEVYAGAQTEVVPGQYVMIAVTDTGLGMTPEIKGRVFEPFFTTKPEGQGTGLGLAQVFGFIKQSGGHVSIYSELGEGTTVRLYLPRLKAGLRPEPPPFMEISRGQMRARGETILLVEDEAGVRAFAIEALEELGYHVLAAENAAAALMLLENAPEIGLLFTDVVLGGGVNGRQLADEAQRRRPNLRVLFTTGYTRNAIIHHGRLDDGVQFIGKPFTIASLARKIRQVLERAPDVEI
jgi:PAS domain S-box-containing protein